MSTPHFPPGSHVDGVVSLTSRFDPVQPYGPIPTPAPPEPGAGGQISVVSVILLPATATWVLLVAVWFGAMRLVEIQGPSLGLLMPSAAAGSVAILGLFVPVHRHLALTRTGVTAPYRVVAGWALFWFIPAEAVRLLILVFGLGMLLGSDALAPVVAVMLGSTALSTVLFAGGLSRVRRVHRPNCTLA